MITKIFHLRSSVQESQSRLAAIFHLRPWMLGLKKNEASEPWQVTLPMGRSILFSLETVSLDQENTVAFRSTSNSLQMAGMIEFFQIQDRLTEIQITLDVKFTEAHLALMDALFSISERFVNERLKSVRTYFEGAEQEATANSLPVLTFGNRAASF